MNTRFQTIIIGGGLSGLTVAHKLRLHSPQHRFLLFEKNKRTGGAIESHHDGGYITEIGPHGFLDNCPESRQLLTETGLDRECVKAPLLDFVRYVYLGGRLNLIPQTPGKILMAPLIPWRAKLRVMAELWQPLLKGEPTVAKWVKHRFGPDLLPFIDAVFTGTYAGDYDRLTIDGVMPGLRELEKKHGSVLRGLLRMIRQKKRAGNKNKITMPAMTSFPSGMQRLPMRLSEDLGRDGNLSLQTGVTAVKRTENGWIVHTGKSDFRAQNIVMALPINETLRLCAKMPLAPPQKSVPLAKIATVVFAFRDSYQLPPGFGFLTPEVEKRFCLGALFSSNMFAARAPKGHIVFETLVGGKRHPERLALDDQTLTANALKDVSAILKLPRQPEYTTVLRPSSAIPQFEGGYTKLQAWKKELEENLPGLHICGFGWGGIGVNDMIKHGTETADKILSPAGTKESGTTVKGIYF